MTYEIVVTYRSGNCTLIVWEDERTISVSALYVNHRRRGHGTEVMRRVIAIAEGMGYSLILRIDAFGDGVRMNNGQLRAFYESLGFKSTDTGIMVRAALEAHGAEGVV